MKNNKCLTNVHIIGAGITGLTLANILYKFTQNVFIYDSINILGGNCSSVYSKINAVDTIEVHNYGPHIFHTSNGAVKNFLSNLNIRFNNYIHKVKVSHEGKYYSFPYNMLTANQIYGHQTVYIKEPNDAKNLEDYLIKKIGRKAYEILYKQYTYKQWGTEGTNIDVNIAKRIPIRNTFNDDYFDDDLQGIPENGYNEMFLRLVDEIPKSNIKLGVTVDLEFLRTKLERHDICIYTGSIDSLIKLEQILPYRSLDFMFTNENIINSIGCAQLNFSDSTPFTRVTDFLYFDYKRNKNFTKTIKCYEFPKQYIEGDERYYPINNQDNEKIYKKYYKALMNSLNNPKKLFLCGRLAEYKYYNMDSAIYNAMLKSEEIIKFIK